MMVPPNKELFAWGHAPRLFYTHLVNKQLYDYFKLRMYSQHRKFTESLPPIDLGLLLFFLV